MSTSTNATPLRVHETSQTSFTSNAALYDTARPSYLPSAVEAMIRMLHLQKGSRVLDLVRLYPSFLPPPCPMHFLLPGKHVEGECWNIGTG